jgi:predicted nucleic acid-binding protein
VGMIEYLVDKSALARLHLPPVRQVLVPFMDRGLVHMCGVTQAEMLFSARNSGDRERLKGQLASSLGWVDTPDDLWRRVEEIQDALTAQAQHRSASVADLMIAATASAKRLTVLHYDNDFDIIAKVTDLSAEWVVPPGTV